MQKFFVGALALLAVSGSAHARPIAVDGLLDGLYGAPNAVQDSRHRSAATTRLPRATPIPTERTCTCFFPASSARALSDWACLSTALRAGKTR